MSLVDLNYLSSSRLTGDRAQSDTIIITVKITIAIARFSDPDRSSIRYPIAPARITSIVNRILFVIGMALSTPLMLLYLTERAAARCAVGDV